MIYGERNIDNNGLKEWVRQWDIKKAVEYLNVKGWGESNKEIVNTEIEILNSQISFAQKLSNEINDESYYDNLMYVVSPLLMDIYFKNDNSSIRVANFYEVFLYATDLETKKKMIKGFEMESKEFGEIEIKCKGTKIGSIGEKSDLIWNVFYNCFIFEDDNGTIEHTHNHEDYFTLQLWNANGIDNDKIDNYIQQILFNCSVKLGLNFKKICPDKLYKERGQANSYSLDFLYKEIEDIPLLYFNSTIEDTSIRIRFLSYYQVIEYYYIRANNVLLRNEFINGEFYKKEKFDSVKITSLMKKYKRNSNEREAIKLVLAKAIDVSKLKSWIIEEAKRKGFYTNNQDENLKRFNLNLDCQDSEVINKLCDRIYSVRCSIVHSKADSTEVMYIPNLNDINLKQELPLMKYVATNVLETWGVNEVM